MPLFEKISLDTPVRYIKLGSGDAWEQECKDKHTIRIGFASAQYFDLCRKGKWEEFKDKYAEARNKIDGSNTNAANQLKFFFEDDGSTLWITFIGEYLHWGYMDTSAPCKHSDGDGVFRKIKGEWKNININDDKLHESRLYGAIKKLKSFRGTSCNVKESIQVINIINAEVEHEITECREAINNLKASLQPLIKFLDDKELELLVDLVFSKSGWQRKDFIGGVQKNRDLDLILPSTGERAYVQAKSKTHTSELIGYIKKIEDNEYNRMFYVYHTGNPILPDGNSNVTLIDADKLSDMIIDAGLVSWLIDRTSNKTSKSN